MSEISEVAFPGFARARTRQSQVRRSNPSKEPGINVSPTESSAKASPTTPERMSRLRACALPSTSDHSPGSPKTQPSLPGDFIRFIIVYFVSDRSDPAPRSRMSLSKPFSAEKEPKAHSTQYSDEPRGIIAKLHQHVHGGDVGISF